MRVLMINNGTKHLKELITVFPIATIITPPQLKDYINKGEFDLIVLSGGSNIPTVLRHPEQYQEELSIISKITTPILGICFGCELIAAAFGGTLHELSERHEGEITLTIFNDELASIIYDSHITVHEAHHIAIETVPKEFEICATSNHGIEIIKHKTKKIIGLQFHPELDRNETLYHWIYKTLGITKSTS
jgi:GMP synthase-like glutamine amidotransferase